MHYIHADSHTVKHKIACRSLSCYIVPNTTTLYCPIFSLGLDVLERDYREVFQTYNAKGERGYREVN